MHISKVFEVATTRREASPLETMPKIEDQTANAVASGILLGAMIFGLGPSKIITRQAHYIFGSSTTSLTKQMSEVNNAVVTIRVLDKKYCYTSMCNGDTLEFDATNGTLTVTGTGTGTGATKTQLPKNLKIVGNPEDVEPLAVVPVCLEIMSMHYLVQALEETQNKNNQLENRLARLEKRLDALDKSSSLNPFI